MRHVELVVLLLVLTACARSTPVVDDIDSVRVSPDGRSLTVTVVHGVCEKGARRLTVVESARDVRVRVDGARALPGECIGMGVQDQLTGRLGASLGQRTVIDDSDDEPVATTSTQP